MNDIIKFCTGAAAVAIIGVLAIHANVLPGSHAGAQSKIDKVVEDALDRSGAEWARYQINGQQVVLIGEAPDSASADDLPAQLGQPSVLAGPITALDRSGVSVSALSETIVWVAEKNGASVSISGGAPSERARDEVIEMAAARFSGAEVAIGLDVVKSSVDEDYWLAMASIGLNALARLRTGGVDFSGPSLTVTGQVDAPKQEREIQALLAGAPAEAQTALQIVIAPAPTGDPNPTATEIAIVAAATEPQVAEPETQIDIEPPAPELKPAAPEPCSRTVAALAASTTIVFGTSEVDFNADSRAQLDALSRALTDCGDADLEIVGHTDSRGSAGTNRRLSLFRADAVAAYLRTQGVDEQRLNTRGAGESAPIASNRTVQGRARNRRIEFVVRDPQ